MVGLARRITSRGSAKILAHEPLALGLVRRPLDLDDRDRQGRPCWLRRRPILLAPWGDCWSSSTQVPAIRHGSPVVARHSGTSAERLPACLKSARSKRPGRHQRSCSSLIPRESRWRTASSEMFRRAAMLALSRPWRRRPIATRYGSGSFSTSRRTRPRSSSACALTDGVGSPELRFSGSKVDSNSVRRTACRLACWTVFCVRIEWAKDKNSPQVVPRKVST